MWESLKLVEYEVTDEGPAVRLRRGPLRRVMPIVVRGSVMAGAVILNTRFICILDGESAPGVFGKATTPLGQKLSLKTLSRRFRYSEGLITSIP